MIRLVKISCLVIAAWAVYGVLLYLDARGLLPLQMPFFVAFYGVALLLGLLAAQWDREAPVLSSFAVGFFSVFQWGYVMSLWQATKGYFTYDSAAPGTMIFLMPLTFAIITGAVAATAGFVLFTLIALLRGGKLVPNAMGWRAVNGLGAKLGFAAGGWVLLAGSLFLSQWFMSDPSVKRLAVLLLFLLCSLGLFVGAGLAKKGQNVQSGIMLMGAGALLSGLSLVLVPLIPASTLIATLPGLVAIGAGAHLYHGTRVLGRAISR